MTDTIYALATPPGRSGVAVVRVSGPGAWPGLKALNSKDISPRLCVIRTLKNPQTDEIIDHALVLGFRAPASFTGEDVVEYHIHGGRAVAQSLIAALSSFKNTRMAEPGEFTRRAFENGKMDLTEAEAIADLINAETQAQKLQALSQMEGELSRLYRGWTDALKKSLAHLEADLEFPDEDLPQGVIPQLTPGIEKLRSEIAAHLDDNRRGERLRDGIHVAVIGAPNAGKSSLVNALAQRDIAIVSDVEGTTRDVIEAHLDLGGYPVILADTAGLRPDQITNEGQGAIESEGIRRALKRAQDADIKLLVFDGTKAVADSHTLALLDENTIIVLNKLDCHPEGAQRLKDLILKERSFAIAQDDIVEISAQSGQGLERLIAALIDKVKALVGTREGPALTRQRHRASLEDAQKSLTRSLNASLPELMAEDMRLAIRALGRITGRVDVEDLLDVIFRDFCIGK